MNKNNVDRAEICEGTENKVLDKFTLKPANQHHNSRHLSVCFFICERWRHRKSVLRLKSHLFLYLFEFKATVIGFLLLS